MFKKLLQQLIDATTEEEILNVFYKVDGIDMMYQKEKITWKEHQMLLALVNKLTNNK